jgi:hypothetical protein
LNPIKQNQGHIDSLCSLISYQFINKVVFSNSMLIGPSSHPKIHSLDSFAKLLKTTSEKKYSPLELEEMFKNLSSLNITDPRAIKLHTARLTRSKLP